MEIDADQIQVYAEQLANLSPYQIEEASKRCLNECEFMPRIVDIRRRAPENRQPESFTGFRQRKPLLDVIRPIAEEIAQELIGKEYREIDFPREIALESYVFFCANIVRYMRMGRRPEQWLGEKTWDPKKYKEVELAHLRKIAARRSMTMEELTG